MAPLPDNNTGIYTVLYQSNSGQHRMQFRNTGSAVVGATRTAVQNFLAALLSLRPADWIVTGATYQAPGTNFALPETPPTVAAGAATALIGTQFPRFITWVGRGAVTGRRVRVFVYGLSFTSPNDYRFSVGELAALESARAALDAAPPGAITTIGLDDPLWYLYQNTGFNSYLERKQRT